MKRKIKSSAKVITSAEKRGAQAAKAKLLEPIMRALNNESVNRTGNTPILSPTACSLLVECLQDGGYIVPETSIVWTTVGGLK